MYNMGNWSSEGPIVLRKTTVKLVNFETKEEVVVSLSESKFMLLEKRFPKILYKALYLLGSELGKSNFEDRMLVASKTKEIESLPRIIYTYIIN